uniref:DDE-1 domain-containing protein n=1 Tax=Acrobeloides nanus TaxID=290746 RepID=A0A914CZE7_9BILA
MLWRGIDCAHFGGIQRARALYQRLEEKAYTKPHPNVESLKRALKKAWNEITLGTLIKIVDDFLKRLKACMDAKGGHFE